MEGGRPNKGKCLDEARIHYARFATCGQGNGQCLTPLNLTWYFIFCACSGRDLIAFARFENRKRERCGSCGKRSVDAAHGWADVRAGIAPGKLHCRVPQAGEWIM